LHRDHVFGDDLKVSTRCDIGRQVLTLVESKRSKSNLCSSSSLTICTPSSHFG
jgi:hypothetical protein